MLYSPHITLTFFLWLIYFIVLYLLYFGRRTKSLSKLLQDNAVPQDFTIAIFGDCQGAGSPFTSLRPTYFVFNRIIEDINSKAPLFSIILGDIVSSGRWHHLRRFVQQLTALKTPVYLVIGNHDAKYNGRRWFTHFFGQTYYSFTVGNNAFLFLDNAAGSLDPEQWRWLQEIITHYEHKSIFVFMHQPVFDPRPRHDYAMSHKKQAAQLVELFTRYQVKAVFSSHLHGFYSAIQNGVSYYITGGGGSRLTSTDDFYHYLQLHIRADSFSVEAVKIAARPSVATLILWLLVIGIFILLLFFTLLDSPLPR